MSLRPRVGGRQAALEIEAVGLPLDRDALAHDLALVDVALGERPAVREDRVRGQLALRRARRRAPRRESRAAPAARRRAGP